MLHEHQRALVNRSGAGGCRETKIPCKEPGQRNSRWFPQAAGSRPGASSGHPVVRFDSIFVAAHGCRVSERGDGVFLH